MSNARRAATGHVPRIKTKPTIDPVGMAALGETRPDLNLRNSVRSILCDRRLSVISVF
jgi:hypothetical protein